MVHSRVDSSGELYLLKKCVPDNAKREIERCEDLDSAWSFLDKEYGNTMKALYAEGGDLSRFCYTEEARTDGDKLLELHQAWRGVYLDLKAGRRGRQISMPPRLLRVSLKSSRMQS